MMAAPSITIALVGIIFGVDVPWSDVALGETPDLGLLDRTMVTHGVVPPLGTSFWSSLAMATHGATKS
jgi:hypothetical protein